MVNFEKLNEVIERNNKSNEFIADALGLTLQGWLNKRKGKNDFTVSNAQNFCKALKLSNKEKIEIFLS